jgi:AcrR family transcriptional regulator
MAPTAQSAESTRCLYLNAAEQLFADKGYDGSTIRAISQRASVQLGALHYYWGNKQKLFLEVINRRFSPVVEARLQRLQQLMEGPLEAKRNILEILKAYYEPLIESAADDDLGVMAKLVLRIQTDAAPEAASALTQVAERAAIPFVALLRAACGHLDEESFYWRLISVFGTMMFVVGNRGSTAGLVCRESAGDNLRSGTQQTLHALALMLKEPSECRC